MRLDRTVVLPAVMLAAVAISGKPAVAAEPAHFAVMGVRLYQSAQEVLTALYAQGVREDTVTEHVHPCALHEAAACTDSITARLPDGPITIRFTDAPAGFNDGREAAFSITYRLIRGPKDSTAVKTVAEERFGPLSSAADGAWCAPTAAACPEDHPRMAFRHGADGADELTLTDLGLPARLAPEAGKAAR
jgi:hypothetical protein